MAALKGEPKTNLEISIMKKWEAWRHGPEEPSPKEVEKITEIVAEYLKPLAKIFHANQFFLLAKDSVSGRSFATRINPDSQFLHEAADAVLEAKRILRKRIKEQEAITNA
jgi:hypothetical protein